MTRWISHLISRTVGLAAGVAAGMALTCHSAAAQDVQELKIGLLATLSGPAAVYGEHMRDGFMLAVEQSNGALGGLPTNVIVVDDKLDPDNALEQATKLIEEMASISSSASISPR